MRLLLALYFMALTILGCSTSQPKSTNEALNLFGPQVINLGSEFERFWKVAKDQSFEKQLSIWNEVVEKHHQSFYNSIVWQNPTNPKWEERKIRQLKKYFALFPKIYSEVAYNFDHFDEVLAAQIERYKKTFPDAKFDLSIYAAPTATFNGKGGEGGDGGDDLGKTVLAFGIDVLTERHDNPDVLYSHELFHIYHTDKIGVNEQVFLSEGKLTLPLWLEGLATYVSEVMNPNAKASEVLMAEDLTKVSPNDISWLAKEFLKEAEEKAFDEKHPEIYKRWFAIGTGSVRKDLPERSGYLLGLKVVEHLAKKNSLSEMVNWKIGTVHQEVRKALAELAGERI